MARHILALDQGTTSTRAILFDAEGDVVASAQRELPQFFPADGWVEHDPEEIWARHARRLPRGAGPRRRRCGDVAALGITNQRETTVLWERASGRPVHNAIVWQDRRTAPLCASCARTAEDRWSQRTTGPACSTPISRPPSSPGCSTTSPAPAPRAERGELAFGTVDSFLLWRLTGGRGTPPTPPTPPAPCCSTSARQDWDEELLRLLGVPRGGAARGARLRRRVRQTEADCFGAAAPDRRAWRATSRRRCSARPASRPARPRAPTAPAASCCSTPASRRSPRSNRLLTTVAWRLGGRATYALEGSVFVAGAAVQWLRDGLRAIGGAAETRGAGGRASPDTGGVYLVPAFTGLGAPHWDPDARGTIFGLTRGTTARRHRPRRAGGGRLPDRRPDRGDGTTLGARPPPARGRRHGGQRLVLPVPGRHPRPAGRAAGVPRRPPWAPPSSPAWASGLWPVADELRPPVAGRPPLRAADGSRRGGGGCCEAGGTRSREC